MFNCQVCNELAKAHGADPNSDKPPKFEFLENGEGQKTPPTSTSPATPASPGEGKKGDSFELTVTAAPGTTLYFMCIIHPWMQAKLDVS